MTMHEYMLDWPLQTQMAFLNNNKKCRSAGKMDLKELLFESHPSTAIHAGFIWDMTKEGLQFWQLEYGNALKVK